MNDTCFIPSPTVCPTPGPVADVSLRAAGALEGEVLGIALWSTMLREIGSGFYVPEANRTPVLAQHDTGDPAVPVGHSEALQQQRNAAGAPTRLMRLPGESHLFSGAAMEDAVERDVAFFRALMTN